MLHRFVKDECTALNSDDPLVEPDCQIADVLSSSDPGWMNV